MSQARSHPAQAAARRTQGRGNQANVAVQPVPELLSRRLRPQPPPPAASRKSPAALLIFALGAALGYGLASPLPSLLGRQLAPLFSQLLHSTPDIGSIIDPLGAARQPVLVMGSDAVSGSTDVMFTLQVKDGVTRVLQVPRDTFVESEQLGVVKANALYAMAGPDTAKAEVSKLVTAPVHHYLKVNLDAVLKVADALGGVKVDVPKRMYYVDNSQGLLIDLYPGPQVLKGRELEGFLRFRHDELGDIGRLQRQRLVLSEVFRRLSQPTALAQLPALLKIAGEDVRTDLSPIQLTQVMAALAHTRLDTSQLAGRPYWQDDLSYWMPETNQNHSSGDGDPPAL
ncbi:MAG: LCP family protein [Synechococcaceae cyanobacterium]|nr:LCP family protein [Synechococcaceae cyanobacterium]